MFTRHPVGANCVRPRAFKERTYNQISAENLSSLPICVIMGIHRRAGLAPTATKGFVLDNGGTNAPPYKGETSDKEEFL